jgi:hypothetical protein
MRNLGIGLALGCVLTMTLLIIGVRGCASLMWHEFTHQPQSSPFQVNPHSLNDPSPTIPADIAKQRLSEMDVRQATGMEGAEHVGEAAAIHALANLLAADTGKARYVVEWTVRAPGGYYRKSLFFDATNGRFDYGSVLGEGMKFLSFQGVRREHLAQLSHSKQWPLVEELAQFGCQRMQN